MVFFLGIVGKFVECFCLLLINSVVIYGLYSLDY